MKLNLKQIIVTRLEKVATSLADLYLNFSKAESIFKAVLKSRSILRLSLAYNGEKQYSSTAL